jgi:hypothetical protein
MKRNDVMPPRFLSRKANITDYAADPATGGENSSAFLPNLIELAQENLIVFHMTKLAGVLPVLLERPIRGRRYDEMNRFTRNPRKIAGIS